MKHIQVKHVVYTATGTELHLNCYPHTTWVYVPGTTRRHSKNPQAKLHFVGLYNVYDAIEILKRAPLINPRTIFLDTPFTMSYTGAFITNNYNRQGQGFLPQYTKPINSFKTHNVRIKKA